MRRRDLIIWAAGFFQGEGCVDMMKSSAHNRRYFRIQAGQNEQEPLLLLKDLFGGSLHLRSNMHKATTPQWAWTLTGEKAQVAFEEMRPYLFSPKMIKRSDAAMKSLQAGF